MSTYEGWSNYETWAVNLWLSNDQGTYNDCQDIAGNNIDDAYDCAQAFKDYVLELSDIATVQGTASLAADLLGAALSEVDWQEIAESWIGDLRESR